MRAVLVSWAFAVLAAAVPQGVTSAIEPSSSPPASCSENYDGSFQIATVNATSESKRGLEERQHSDLGITLRNGILKDQQGRTGYVASNSQFQFDDPPQAGAIYTAGFSVCSNGRLTLGNDDTWYRCLSGPGSTNDGFFYNLYLENDAGQCIESHILARPVGDSGPILGSATPTPASSSSSAAVSSSMSTIVANTSSSSMMIASSMPVVTNGTVTTSATSTSISESVSSSVAATTSRATTTTRGQQEQSTTIVRQTTANQPTTAGASAVPTGAAPLPLAARGDLLGLAVGVLAVAMI